MSLIFLNQIDYADCKSFSYAKNQQNYNLPNDFFSIRKTKFKKSSDASVKPEIRPRIIQQKSKTKLDRELNALNTDELMMLMSLMTENNVDKDLSRPFFDQKDVAAKISPQEVDIINEDMARYFGGGPFGF